MPHPSLASPPLVRVSAPRPKPLLGRLLLSVAAGAVLACGFPPIGWPVLLPFGVALLVSVLEESNLTPRQGAYAGLAAGLTLFAITIHWLFNLFGAAAIPLIFIAAAFPMLFSGWYVWLRRRLSRMPAWLLAGVLWTGVEYYRSELFWLSFGWMGLGYGPIEHGALAAAASVVGSYGISFVIAALGAAMVTAPLPKPARALYVASLAALWLAVYSAPAHVSEPNNPISVRLVQSRAGEAEESLRLSRSKEAPAADVILWPEYSVLDDPTRDKRLWPQLQQLARDERCWLILGGKEAIPGGNADAYHSTAFVLDPEGNLVGKHYKNHTVHLLADGMRGADAAPVHTGLGPLGVAICFDMDYPGVARRLTQQGAEVFLVPNMDPAEWGDLQRAQHRLIFQMRAAECGRWLARADVAGGTSVAAPNGREAEEIGTDQPKAMNVIVGREQGRTLYVRGGWMFGPACLLATVFVFVVGWLRSRGKTEGTAEASGPPSR